MSLTLSDLRRLLRRGLGNLDSDDLSNDECDELLNMALWEVENDYPFEIKETLYSSSLVEDQYEYDLSGISALDAITSVSYINEHGKSINLDRMTRKIFDDIFDDGTENTEVSGDPERYMREGNVLTIWPPPKEELDTQELRIALKESILTVTSSGTGLPKNWDQIILAKAITLGHFFNQDYDLGAKSENFAVSKARSAVPTETKEETDSRHAGLSVLWDHPHDDEDDDD